MQRPIRQPPAELNFYSELYVVIHTEVAFKLDLTRKCDLLFEMLFGLIRRLIKNNKAMHPVSLSGISLLLIVSKPSNDGHLIVPNSVKQSLTRKVHSRLASQEIQSL